MSIKDNENAGVVIKLKNKKKGLKTKGGYPEIDFLDSYVGVQTNNLSIKDIKNLIFKQEEDIKTWKNKIENSDKNDDSIFKLQENLKSLILYNENLKNILKQRYKKTDKGPVTSSGPFMGVYESTYDRADNIESKMNTNSFTKNEVEELILRRYKRLETLEKQKIKLEKVIKDIKEEIYDNKKQKKKVRSLEIALENKEEDLKFLKARIIALKKNIKNNESTLDHRERSEKFLKDKNANPFDYLHPSEKFAYFKEKEENETFGDLVNNEDYKDPQARWQDWLKKRNVEKKLKEKKSVKKENNVNNVIDKLQNWKLMKNLEPEKEPKIKINRDEIEE